MNSVWHPIANGTPALVMLRRPLTSFQNQKFGILHPQTACPPIILFILRTQMGRQRFSVVKLHLPLTSFLNLNTNTIQAVPRLRGSLTFFLDLLYMSTFQAALSNIWSSNNLLSRIRYDTRFVFVRSGFALLPYSSR